MIEHNAVMKFSPEEVSEMMKDATENEWARFFMKFESLLDDV